MGLRVRQAPAKAAGEPTFSSPGGQLAGLGCGCLYFREGAVHRMNRVLAGTGRGVTLGHKCRFRSPVEVHLGSPHSPYLKAVHQT